MYSFNFCFLLAYFFCVVFRNHCFGNGGFEYKGNKNAWISVRMFANLSFFYLFKYCLFFRNASFESKNDGIVRIEVIFLSGKYAYCILSSIESSLSIFSPPIWLKGLKALLAHSPRHRLGNRSDRATRPVSATTFYSMLLPLTGRM